MAYPETISDPRRGGTLGRPRFPGCADSRPFPIHRKPVKAHGKRPPGFAPGALARETQAQKLNRSSNDFLPIQGPSGPGLNRGTSLRFCAPEMTHRTNRGAPLQMGVWGCRDYGHASAHRNKPPASFGSFSTWKRNPPRRAEPCKRARRGRRALRSAEMAAKSPPKTTQQVRRIRGFQPCIALKH